MSCWPTPAVWTRASCAKACAPRSPATSWSWTPTAATRSATRCCARSCRTTSCPARGWSCTRALAQALERRAAAGDASVATVAAIASYHLAAGDHRAALAASVRAAAAAEAVHAPAEAAALLERALGLWSRVPDAEAVAGLDHADLLRRARRGPQPRRPAQPGGVAAALGAGPGRRGGRAAPGGEPDGAPGPLPVAPQPRRGVARDPARRRPAAAARRGLARARRPAGHVGEGPDVPGALPRGRRAGARRHRRWRRRAATPPRWASRSTCWARRSIALGEIEEGAAALRRAGEIAVERGDPLEIDSAACNLADALHGAGRSREAVEAARRGIDELAASPNTHRWLELMVGRDRVRPRRLGAGGPHAARARAALRRPHAAQRRAAPPPPGARPGRPRRGRGVAASACAPRTSSRPNRSSSAPFGVLQAELLRRNGDLDGARAADRRRRSTGSSTAPRTSRASAGWPRRRRSRGRRRGARARPRRRCRRDRRRSAGSRLAGARRGRGRRRRTDRARPSRHGPGRCGPRLGRRRTPRSMRPPRRPGRRSSAPTRRAPARWREAEAHLARGDRDAARDGRPRGARDGAPAGRRMAGRRGRGPGAPRPRCGWMPTPPPTRPPMARVRADDPFGLTAARAPGARAASPRGATNREIGASSTWPRRPRASTSRGSSPSSTSARARRRRAVAHRLGLAEETAAP